MIELARIRKTYGDKIAFASLSIKFETGEITALLGPSGCGKTTALKLINRLIEPDAGTIMVRGRNVRTYDPVELRRGIGYVIQEVGLFPHYTVAENIALVPRLLGWPKERVNDRVAELLGLVTLDGSFAGRYPGRLSGGECQRVGLARALGADPDILLMDEPFGQVDAINRGALQNVLLNIQKRLRKTIVIVTHDIDEAFKLADRIAVLKDGRLLRFDSPAAILKEPGDPFVAGLLESARARDRET